MGQLGDVVFDCRRPASLARFWAAALDGYEVAPYDEDELERLRGLGIHDPEDDPGVLVERPGTTPRFFFQRVREAKIVKNRVHLDLRAEDPDVEVERLVSIGATVMPDQASNDWVTLRDPEGDEFCILRR